MFKETFKIPEQLNRYAYKGFKAYLNGILFDDNLYNDSKNLKEDVKYKDCTGWRNGKEATKLPEFNPIYKQQ